MRLATLFAILASITTLLAQSRDINRTLPLTAKGHLEIDTYKGEVRVTTWDQPQVEVYARIEVDGTSAESQRLANSTEVRIDSTGDTLRLKSDYPKMLSNWMNDDDARLPFVKYTIKMPRTAQLRIKDYKSEIEVSDLNAPLEIETYKGDTRVMRHAGTIRMNTYKGNGTFELSAVTGSNSFETYKGVFDIRLPANAGFDVTSEYGRHATLRSSFPFVLPAGTYSNDNHLTARVNGGGAQLVLKSYRGEMNIH
jgi:hypothetical protein